MSKLSLSKLSYLSHFAAFHLLHALVYDEIHKRVVSSQRADQVPTAVDLKPQPLVHELLEFGRTRLRHFDRRGRGSFG